MVAVHPEPDAVDRILLHHIPTHRQDGPAVALDDQSGALLAGLASAARPVRVHCDYYPAEVGIAPIASSLGAAVHPRLSAALFEDARLVVMRLPKSLAALDEVAEQVAVAAHPGVILLAGGRTKFMSRGMNTVLGRHFADVSASLGSQKCRVLLASSPRSSSTPASYPRRQHHGDLDLTVAAHGAAFAGTSVDSGTRLLVQQLPRMPADARRLVDLGCGTGVLATMAARQLPESRVLAVDASAAACLSARVTADANGVGQRVDVQRCDVLTGVASASADAVLCNPPFHSGTSRDSSVAFEMFAAASLVLRPGGQLWTVFNSHLPYRSALRRQIGPTDVLAQDPWYTLTRSVRRALP